MAENKKTAFKALNTAKLNEEYEKMLEEDYSDFGSQAPFFHSLDTRLKKRGEKPLFKKDSPSLKRQNTPDPDDIDFNPIIRGVTPEIERSLSEQKEQIEAFRKKMAMAGIKPRSESAPPSSNKGGTRKRRKRKRRKSKRRKSKKGGGIFSISPEKKKRRILKRLLKGDKHMMSQCLELNDTGKACEEDKKKTPGVITQSCARYNGMVRGATGPKCSEVLRKAVRIYQEGAAKKRRTKRRKRKRRNSTRRKKRS